MGRRSISGWTPPDRLESSCRAKRSIGTVQPAPTTGPPALCEPAAKPVGQRWQLRAADGWRDITVRDNSNGMARPGVATLILPDAASEWQGNALDPRKLVWLRIVWPVEPGPGALPRLPTRLVLNGVAVRNTQWLSNEIVGSSNGRPGQVFKALRTPIIGDVLLQLRESDDNWVDWNEVATLASSEADARDFTLNRSTGELRFGDGRTGRIPPAGANNVRLREYTIGGGSTGNQPASATVQLRSAIPSVDSAIMLGPASGGLDAEDAASVHRHASAWIRIAIARSARMTSPISRCGLRRRWPTRSASRNAILPQPRPPRRRTSSGGLVLPASSSFRKAATRPRSQAWICWQR